MSEPVIFVFCSDRELSRGTEQTLRDRYPGGLEQAIFELTERLDALWDELSAARGLPPERGN